MKKLSKLKLNDVAILSDGEMKNVVGGFMSGTGTGDINSCDSCTGDCTRILDKVIYEGTNKCIQDECRCVIPA